jgi:hypothetical protein
MINKTDLFKNAWYFVNKKIVPDFATGLRLSWIREKLISNLRTGDINFAYVKKTDRSLRQAKGTLHPRVVGSMSFSGEASTTKPNIVRYYDLGSDGWRSFDVAYLAAARHVSV